MTEETVKRVSELYKLKGEIFLELEKMNNTEEYVFVIGYDKTKTCSMYGAVEFKTYSEDFREKVRQQTIEHLQDRLKEIDNELETL